MFRNRIWQNAVTCRIVRTGEQVEQTMIQTTEHRPYVGLAAVLSHHGQSSAFPSTGRRRGFTLIEVMIALVIIGLAGMGLATFSMQSYRTVQNLTIRATAENLAKVTLEELSSMAGSTLDSMTHSPNYLSINFPENGYIQHDPGQVPGAEALNAAAACVPPPVSGATTFTVTPGTYHVLCNGQLLLGTYNSFFAVTTTPRAAGKVGPLNDSGAVVTSDGTSDWVTSSPWSSFVTRTGPYANDYNTVYSPSQITSLPSEDPSGYEVYKYELGSGIYLEPIYQGTGILDPWQSAGLLVFASAAPHLYREVTVTDPTPSTDTTTPSSARMYQISVRVIWTFGAVRQLVEVTGGK